MTSIHYHYYITMKGFKELSAVALSLLAYTVSAEEAAPAAEEVATDVHVLKTDTFGPFVKEHPLVLAECELSRLIPVSCVIV